MPSPGELVIPERYTLPHIIRELGLDENNVDPELREGFHQGIVWRLRAIEQEGAEYARLNIHKIPPTARVTFSVAMNNGGEGRHLRAGQQDITVVRGLDHFAKLRSIQRRQIVAPEGPQPKEATYHDLEINDYKTPIFIAGVQEGTSNIDPRANRLLVPTVSHLGGLVMRSDRHVDYGEHVPDDSIVGGSAAQVMGIKIQAPELAPVVIGEPFNL